jgi:hypothetical protein
MYDVQPKLTARDVLGYVIAYVFWLLAALLAMGAIFMLRAALNAFWPAMKWNRWLLRPVDRFGLMFMGLLWLVYVIFCEHHFRSSITEVRNRRMQAHMHSQPQAAGAGGSRVMKALRRLDLDVLARRLLPTLSIPLIALGVGYLVYSLSWVIMAR